MAKDGRRDVTKERRRMMGKGVAEERATKMKKRAGINEGDRRDVSKKRLSATLARECIPYITDGEKNQKSKKERIKVHPISFTRQEIHRQESHTEKKTTLTLPSLPT